MISVRRASPYCSRICEELVAHHLGETLGARQDIVEIADAFQQSLVLLDDPVLLEAGEAIEAHVQNRLRLRFGQVVGLAFQPEFSRQVRGPGGDRARALEELRHNARAPGHAPAMPCALPPATGTP